MNRNNLQFPKSHCYLGLEWGPKPKLTKLSTPLYAGMSKEALVEHISPELEWTTTAPSKPC